MEIETKEKMPFVPLSKLKALVKRMRNMSDDTEITFEFLMTALFPTIFESVRSYMKDCYTAGYQAGLEAGKNEEKNEG